jgi:DNA-binding NarL/FixJ family response regulator
MCGTVDVVSEASSMGELVALSSETGPDIVIVGFDPAEYGVIRRFRRDPSPPRVLVLSPSSAEQDVVRALTAGASAYLSKSADADEFAAAVETLRAGGTYLDKTAAVAVQSALERGAGAKKPISTRLGDLTNREMEIARLLCQGLTARTIASRLGISDRTVNTHVGSLYRRLGVNNRVDAVRELLGRGVAAPPR